MIVACSSGSAWCSCSAYCIVVRIRIAVPPCALSSGWLVWQRLYPGMEKYVFDVKCVSLTKRISILFCVRKSLTSSLWFGRPLAFHCAILRVLYILDTAVDKRGKHGYDHAVLV